MAHVPYWPKIDTSVVHRGRWIPGELSNHLGPTSFYVLIEGGDPVPGQYVIVAKSRAETKPTRELLAEVWPAGRGRWKCKTLRARSNDDQTALTDYWRRRNRWMSVGDPPPRTTEPVSVFDLLDE